MGISISPIALLVFKEDKVSSSSETWPLAKVPEVAHIVSFYPQGVKIELVFALRAAVSKIRATIFRHETWPLAKFPEVPHILPFYPGGRNQAYFALRATVKEIKHFLP